MTLEDRIAQIEQRNSKVSIDKAWETSLTRRLSIAIVTYICACVFLFVIPNQKWYFASLVPVMGYILSTLGLPQIRKIWQSCVNN